MKFFKKTDKPPVPEIEKKKDIALKIDNLNFRYKPNHPKVICDVSLEIKQGEYVVILGHNGSGKSTLSKLIIGVLNYSEGSIEIFGHKVNSKNISKIRKYLGIVFQNPDNQFIGSTVQDDIAFGLENRQVPQEQMEDIIVEAAKKVDMLEFLNQEPLMLSGGQKQKVAIASTIALKPDVLIFDEATSMLDPKGKADIKKIMLELKHISKKTIISISHDMNEALNADKIIVMNKGKISRIGTPKEILEDLDFLHHNSLDAPFIYKVCLELNKQNIKINNTLSEKELVEQLCEQIN